MRQGLFITLEGTEGAGKSTQLLKIKAFLETQGRRVICLREPGGTPIAEQIRKILKTPSEDDKLCAKAELLLMYAARAQLVETLIKPKLCAGFDIVCDRHDLSTAAYQGGGRQLPSAWIDALRTIALGGLNPNLTLLFDLDPKIGMLRARKRGELDRFELEGLEFLTRVRNTYLEYAKKDPKRIKIIDASSDIEAVSAAVLSKLKEILC